MAKYERAIAKDAKGSERGEKASHIYFAVLTASIAWIGSILAAPLLMARGYPIASAVFYRAFSAVCHQMPERSFHFFGLPLGVCSRCTGIYSGFIVGLLIYPMLRRIDEREAPSPWWLIVLAIPALLDFAGGYLGIFANTHLSRALTGGLLGAGAAFYILPGLVSIFCFVRNGEQNLRTS